MNIQILEQKTDDMRFFDKKEWKIYDVLHFGKSIKWDTKFYYLKAEDKSGILGTMELKIEGGVGKINTILVGNKSQRKGVGKALMQKADELTKENNGHKMFLITGKNWEAVKFYKALGFEKTGELRDHYFHVDFIEMSKFI